ncbi:hypothetical protein HUT17_05235 (plasmid) [Nocardiopsis flavescens]|nr:hypothetical protein HUT17_05235 [Nocardiopsis flavescens]
MADDSAELVEQTATALVRVMATRDQEWAPVREELSALFAKAAHVAAAELERSRTEVVQDPALVGEAIGEWKAKLRRLVRANPETAAPMREILGRLNTDDVQPRVSNTITGNVTGTAVQAHTVHGGVGNTTYGGDHVEQSHIRAGRDVIGVQNNHRHGRDSDQER